MTTNGLVALLFFFMSAVFVIIERIPSKEPRADAEVSNALMLFLALLFFGVGIIAATGNIKS